MLLVLGNEARHFGVKTDTVANRAAGTPPGAANYTYTILPGIATPFVGEVLCPTYYTMDFTEPL